jgi:AP-2 complex subunit mu-1
MSDIFRIQIIANSNVRSPVNTFADLNFLHVRHENLYIAACTKDNSNAAMIFEFLYKFISIGKSYFGKFDDDAVKNNFVLIYELLDGMIICVFVRF